MPTFGGAAHAANPHGGGHARLNALCTRARSASVESACGRASCPSPFGLVCVRPPKADMERDPARAPTHRSLVGWVAGSRAGEGIYKEVEQYSGTLQSDAASFYKKIEGDAYPDITRIACLQHIKRRFIECQGYDTDSAEMVRLINKLYHEEHKHKVGEEGWTVQDNLKWRQQYAPPILAEIRSHLEKMLARNDLLPKSDLAEAVRYFDMEWHAAADIFKRGDTRLDNNLVERMNRYFSMSRRSSLFFGSHKGAERAAVLYTLALSAKMHGINLFNYIVDIIEKTATWQPNTPLDKYRDLLPDRWSAE